MHVCVCTTYQAQHCFQTIISFYRSHHSAEHIQWFDAGTQNIAVLPYMKHVNALLQQAVTTCKAAQDSITSAPKEPLPVKEAIPSGKNYEHQWRFKQTSKTPGRKKSGLVLRLDVLVSTLCT